MAARAAQTPAGKVSEILADGAERQGAYDLLETGPVALLSHGIHLPRGKAPSVESSKTSSVPSVSSVVKTT